MVRLKKDDAPGCARNRRPVSKLPAVTDCRRLLHDPMSRCVKDRGYTLQDNEAEQLVSHLDTDTNGTVDYLDWLAAMVDWHKASPCCAFANLQQGNAA